MSHFISSVALAALSRVVAVASVALTAPLSGTATVSMALEVVLVAMETPAKPTVPTVFVAEPNNWWDIWRLALYFLIVTNIYII